MLNGECAECGENTYSGEGSYVCTECPEGMLSAAGSTSESDCEYGTVLVYSCLSNIFIL